MKRVAIVCGSPSTQFLAPFGNPLWDIWVLGNRLNEILDRKLRYTRIFEIHDDLANQENGYADWLKAQAEANECAIITGNNFPGAGPYRHAFGAQKFPFDQAENIFGSTYLTSSSAFMMALAIIEGYDEIAVYGVDMAVNDEEYFWQRPCMEAWIGFAKGLGIIVTIPEQAAILKSHYVEGQGAAGKPNLALVPFSQAQFTAMAARHEKLITGCNDLIAQAQNSIRVHQGAMQAYRRMSEVARAVEGGTPIATLVDQIRMATE